MALFPNLTKSLDKLKFTVQNCLRTAYYHYGQSPLSYFRFVYYSALRINTFLVYENDLSWELPDHNLDSDFKVIKANVEEFPTKGGWVQGSRKNESAWAIP